MDCEWSDLDVPHWFGCVPAGCDVPHWIPFMTSGELGIKGPKLTIDRETGEVFFDPGKEPEADVEVVEKVA